MSIAINEDHVALADTVAAFLTQRGSLTEARARLDGAPEALPDFWGELAGLGWLGLHLGEDVGGSGFGLEELVVVAEQTGRALMPGPFLPTVIASAAVQSAGTDEQRARLLPGLADGSVTAAVALDGDVTVADGKASGFVRTAVGAGIAALLVVPVGSDVVVVTLGGPAADPVAGVSIGCPTTSTHAAAPARSPWTAPPDIAGAGADRLSPAAVLGEAVSIAGTTGRRSTPASAFGRPSYSRRSSTTAQHARAWLATSGVWGAARTSGHRRLLRRCGPLRPTTAADLCAQLNIQVHGGIGFTWEHDAHMFLRRATAVERVVSADHAASALTDLHRSGVRRSVTIELPPEAEAFRDEVRTFAERIKGLPADEQRTELIDSGYVMPHWRHRGVVTPGRSSSW